MTRKELLQAIIGGAAALAVLWYVAVLTLSFGDEARCVTVPYRVGDRPACVEARR